MKSKVLHAAIVSLVCCVLLPAICNGQITWENLAGLNGKYARQLFHRGDTLILETNVRYNYRSVDAGLSWQALYNGNPLLVSNAGTYFTGGYYSYNAGQSWGYLYYPNHGGYQVAFDSTGKLYAAGDSGFFVSPDLRSWTPVLPRVKAPSIFEVAGDGKLLLGTPDGFSFSVDGGLHWTSFTQLPAKAPNALALPSSDHWLVQFDTATYYTTDAGASWSRVAQFRGDLYTAIFASGHFWIATSLGLYESPDLQTWTYSTSPAQKLDARVLMSYAGTLYGGSNSVSRVTGSSITILAGISAMRSISQFVAVIAMGNTYLASDGGKMFRSTNRGASWKQFNIGNPQIGARSLVRDREGNIYAAVPGQGALRSSDTGVTWQVWNDALGDLDLSFLAVDSASVLYGINEFGQYRKPPEWVWQTMGSLPALQNYVIAPDFRIFASPLGQGLMLSTDDGFTFKYVALEEANVNTVETYGHSVYFGTDGGTYTPSAEGNWAKIDGGQYGRIWSVKMLPSGGLLEAGDRSLYFTPDTGRSWSTVTGPVMADFSTWIDGIAVDDSNHILICANNAVYRSHERFDPTLRSSVATEPTAHLSGLYRTGEGIRVSYTADRPSIVHIRLVSVSGEVLRDLYTSQSLELHVDRQLRIPSEFGSGLVIASCNGDFRVLGIVSR